MLFPPELLLYGSLNSVLIKTNYFYTIHPKSTKCCLSLGPCWEQKPSPCKFTASGCAGYLLGACLVRASLCPARCSVWHSSRRTWAGRALICEQREAFAAHTQPVAQLSIYAQITQERTCPAVLPSHIWIRYSRAFHFLAQCSGKH